MKKITFLLCLFATTALSAQQSANNTLLWKISGPYPQDSYLFGTVHLSQKKFVEYGDSVYNAINETSALYTEVDFLDQDDFGLEMMTFLNEKQKEVENIKKSEAWKKMIDRHNRKYKTKFKYDSDEFTEFGQKQMLKLIDPDPGMQVPDMMLASHAKLLGKRTGGIETIKSQVNLVYELLNARLADSTLDFEDEAGLLGALKRNYTNQRLDSIGYFIDQMNPSFRTIIFERRNTSMADSIEKKMLDQPGFFAVGAGHLTGSYGLIELLRKKGFTVTPVHSTNRLSLLLVNDMLQQVRVNTEVEAAGRTLSDTVAALEKSPVEENNKSLPPPPPPPPKTELKKIKSTGKNND